MEVPTKEEAVWKRILDALRVKPRAQPVKVRPKRAPARSLRRQGPKPRYDWDSVEGWGSKSDHEIARELGCHPASVSRVRKQLGKPASPHARVPDEKWDEVDWAKSDAEIGEELGLSRQRVHQVRHRMRQPSATESRRKRVRRQLTELEGELHRMTVDDIAERLGIARSRTLYYLRMNGYRGGVDYRMASYGKPRRKAWSVDWDSVDWENKYNAEIARELGVNASQVTQVRRRLGKPKGPDGRTVSPHRRARASFRPDEVRDLFREHRVLTARDIMEMGMPHGTTYMVLRVLREEGFVTRIWTRRGYVYVITETPSSNE